MIVPQYWADARIQVRAGGKQITVRRFGWSDSSMEEAQAMADARAREALARIQSGEKLDRRERRIPYNGAEGVPIREEIVARHGETILTRNSYGAVCLNTPDVMFVDVDTELPPPRVGFEWMSCLIVLFFFGGLLVAPRWLGPGGILALVGVGSVLVVVAGGFEAGRQAIRRRKYRERATKRANSNLDAFSAAHPDWHLRVYETPAGYRILAMHRIFSPFEPEVAQCFGELGADEMYVRMCIHQNCFRARVSPKPWRMGMSTRMKPRPGVWPIDPERLPERQEWVREYEEKSADYASCRFLRAVGDVASVHPAAERVRALHDDLCRVGSELPLA